MYTVVYFLDGGMAYGGAVHTLIQQAELVKRAGNQVYFFRSDYYGEEPDIEYSKILFQKGIECRTACFQLSPQPEDIDVVCLNDNFQDVLKAVSECEPDLLHSVQLNPMAELIGRKLGIPHIMNIYPLSPDFFKLNYLDVFPHYHICDSLYWGEQWNRYFKTDYVCIRTVVEKIHNKKIRMIGEELNCLCVGALYSGKNQLEVIRGFHSAMKKGFHGRLLLYGSDKGNYAEECRDYIRENNLDSFVFIKGFVRDMEPVYENGDVLICGSRRESYPNAVSEATGHGLAVLSTPVGGIPEIIRDGENGFLTQGMDSDSITSGLMRIKQSMVNGGLQVVVDNAYRTACRLHSPEAVQKQILDYYQYVMEDFCEWQKEKRPGYEDVIKSHQSLIQKFKQHRLFFLDEKNVSIKLWYIKLIRQKIKEALNDGKDFYVWGTGKMSSSVLELLQIFFEKIKIKGVIDSFKDGKYGQYDISPPERILGEKNVVIFLALCNGQWDAEALLKKYHKQYLEDYFILCRRSW